MFRAQSKSSPSYLNVAIKKLSDIERQLDTQFEVTLLREMRHPIIKKLKETRELMTAASADKINELERDAIDRSLTNTSVSLQVLQAALNNAVIQDHSHYSRGIIYPAAYIHLVDNLNSSLLQAIKLFEDYRSIGSRLLHPLRHHSAEANMIISRLKLYLKDDSLTDGQKLDVSRNYVLLVKNTLLATAPLSRLTQKSSFLMRVHFVMDKLLMPISVQHEQTGGQYRMTL